MKFIPSYADFVHMGIKKYLKERIKAYVVVLIILVCVKVLILQ